MEINKQKLANFLEANRFSGNVAIVQNHNPLFEASLGYAHRGFSITNNFDIRYGLASITKMFTAIAILSLVDAGKCSLEDKIVKFVDSFPLPIAKTITIKDLLTHSSGLPDYIDEDNPNSFTFANNNLLLSIDDYVNQITVSSFETSSRGTFYYNNYGYVLLGKIIEIITQESYYDYVTKSIFEKARMNKSGFFRMDQVDEDVAEGYDYQDNTWIKNIYCLPNKGASDGGAFSTVHDLILFIAFINEHKLLSAKWTQHFLQDQITIHETNDSISRYGFGNRFLIEKYSKHIIRWGHTGEDIGISTRLFYYPKDRITVVILSNVSESAGKIMNFIQNMIMN